MCFPTSDLVELGKSEVSLPCQVDKIITDGDEARAEGAKGAVKPPVVMGIDQNNKKASHKPETVTNLSKE